VETFENLMISKTSGMYGIRQFGSDRHRRAAYGKMKLALRNITKLTKINFLFNTLAMWRNRLQYKAHTVKNYPLLQNIPV
jgi:hypothetical protein